MSTNEALSEIAAVSLHLFREYQRMGATTSEAIMLVTMMVESMMRDNKRKREEEE